MRQIVLDTETTGLEVEQGHRIIEIAAMEVANRQITDKHFHCYLNPERAIDLGAAEVHGITEESLQDKPKFAEIAQDFLDFIAGAELIIHNAKFDVGFLDMELENAGLQPLKTYCAGVVDTLRMARDLHPGKRNSLDALCERYAIDNSKRTLHGALIDTNLLAEVYLAMTRGQDTLDMRVDIAPRIAGEAGVTQLDLKVIAANAEELAEHAQYLAALDKESKGNCVWNKLETLN